MDSKDRTKELRAEVENWVNDLAKHMDTEQSSEQYRQWLEVQAKFHKYSWHNTLLILSQCPTAQQVAGYKEWQKLGRQVRKGDTEASHPSVDLQVHVDRSFVGNLFESAGFGELVEDRGQPGSDDVSVCAAVDSVEHENGPIDSCLA